VAYFAGSDTDDPLHVNMQLVTYMCRMADATQIIFGKHYCRVLSAPREGAVSQWETGPAAATP
jgi:hypothetical protein